MRSRRGLATAPLEIDNRYDLEVFAASPLGEVTPIALAAYFKVLPECLYGVNRVGSAAAWPDLRLWTLAIQRQMPKIPIIHTDELCSLGR